MIKLIQSFEVPDDNGENFSRFSIYESQDVSDNDITSHVEAHYPSEHCTHSHDCCGHAYPSKAYWSRINPYYGNFVVEQRFILNI